jgi:hypothetical protein
MAGQDRQARDNIDRAGSSDRAALQRQAAGAIPGKSTLVDAYAARGLVPVQAKGDAAGDTAAVHEAAERGTQGAPTALPYADRISPLFGRHDVSQVQAFIGGPAREATAAMGATAYATGNKVAFRDAPDLHTAAHEAAHVVQQRSGVQLKGGVGEAGDAYERHADAVADRVVAGQSAEALLDASAPGGPTKAIQRDGSADDKLLADQAKLKNTDQEIPVLEGALLSTRLQAVKRGLLSQASYDAGLALSQAMTKLQPAVAAKGTIDKGLQGQAAVAAQQLFTALQKEAGADSNFKVVPSMGDSATVTSENPYTSELRTTSYFFIWSSQVTAGWLQRLPELIRDGNWPDAFRGYRQILDGLDMWVADQLRKTGKGTPDDALGNAQRHYAQLRTGLEQIADKHATRLPALFHPDPKTVAEEKAAGRPVADAIPMNVYFWKEQDGRTHLYDLTAATQPREQIIAGEPTAAAMNTFFEEVARYPKGSVHYSLPSGGGGVAPTTGKLKWYEWVGIAGLVIAGVGLVVLSAGASIPATVIFATGAVAGGVSAAGHLADSVNLGTATTASVVLDVAQIVSAFASFGALGITVKAGSAAAAVSNSRLFVPLFTTAAGADVVQLVALTDVTVEELDKIQKGAGSSEDKQRAMAVLLTQLIVAFGLTALSVQGARNAHALQGKPLEVVEEGGVPVLRIVGETPPASKNVPPNNTKRLKELADAINDLKTNNAKRNEVLEMLRTPNDGKPGPLEGHVLDTALQENQAAIRDIVQALHDNPPDVIVGMKRGGAFLTDVLAEADPALAGKVREMDVHKAVGDAAKKGKFEQDAMQQEFEALIQGGAKKIAIVDTYMGGRTASSLRDQVMKPLAEKYPDVKFEVHWLREQMGLPDQKLRGTIDTGRKGATQIQAVEHPVRMAIGDDMTMVFDPTSTKPITIFDKDGNIVKVFEPKPGQTSRDVLIELLTGQQTP